jgi:hypothetical protein
MFIEKFSQKYPKDWELLQQKYEKAVKEMDTTSLLSFT